MAIVDIHRHDVLVAILASINKQIAEAEAIIGALGDKNAILMAQVTLADMENARYEVEGELIALENNSPSAQD